MIENSAQASMLTQENKTGTASGLTRGPLHAGRLGLNSHLTMGTGGATSMDTLERVLVASGTKLTTVVVRRFTPGTKQNVLEILQRNNIAALPNTAGYYTARDAVLAVQLAHGALETNLLKLEVITGEDTLLPGPVELVTAARQLVADDFAVFTYTNNDPALAKRLEDLGCAAVTPTDSPIDTDLGILNPHNIELIVNRANVPIILNTGIGTTSEAAQAMELGYDVVLLAPAVTRTRDSVGMAMTMRLGVKAGLIARKSDRIPRRRLARAGSSFEGIITERISSAREQDSL